MYLLDTNIVAEIARNPHGKTATRTADLPNDAIGINPIIACEIEYGLAKRGSTKLRRQVEAVLSAVPVLDIPGNIADHYGRIRVELERQGRPIGPYDLLIAAHALASDLILVTGNDSEFRRVKPLKVENWVSAA